jgi:hypothetical protein
MAGQLVDEIIIINFILSQTATQPRPHRKFAVMWDYLGSEPKYTLNLSNYQSAEILANFKDYQQVFIKLWFSSGGQYLTIYKYTAGSQNTAPAVDPSILDRFQCLDHIQTLRVRIDRFTRFQLLYRLVRPDTDIQITIL